jgi:hypothetical protein
MPPDHITSPVCASPEIEQWLPVPGWPGYEASTFGRICSFWTVVRPGGLPRAAREQRKEEGGRRRILKGGVLPSGHRTVILSRQIDGRTEVWRTSVHLVILETFHGPRPAKGMEACHFDGDPANNRPDNLRWDTRSANMLDRLRHGTTKSHLLREADIPAIWARLVAGEKIVAIAKDYHVSSSVISVLKRGDSWGHITRHLPGKPTFRDWGPNRPRREVDPPFRLEYRP